MRDHPPVGDPTRYALDDPAIQAENRVRSEHSTRANNYGTRMSDAEANGNPKSFVTILLIMLLSAMIYRLRRV